MAQSKAPDSEDLALLGGEDIELEIMDGPEELARLLLVEASELQRRRTTRLIQESRGHEVIPVSSGSAARAALREEAFDVILASTEEGLEEIEQLLEVVADAYPGTPVILMAGATSYRGARSLLRKGASACLMKPVGELQLMRSVEDALSRYRRPKPITEGARRSRAMGMIGDCAAMTELRRRIAQVARHNITTLIEGPAGSGKELVARALHQESGRPGAFITVDCGALSAGTLEAQLFGNEAGWAGASAPGYRGLIRLADGGTLFLDGLDNLAPAAQSRFLRVVEDRSVRPLGAVHEERVDIRVVASTTQDLRALVQRGTFRQDLLDRISELRLRVPALTDREGDLPTLACHFADAAAREYRRGPVELSVGALQRLETHSWPGNVRELRAVIRAAVLLAEGTQILESHLELEAPYPVETIERAAPAAALTLQAHQTGGVVGPGRDADVAPRTQPPPRQTVAADPDLPAALLRAKLEVISAHLSWAEAQATSRKEQAALLKVSLRTLHNYLRLVEEEGRAEAS